MFLLSGAESLCQDYKKMFLEGQNPDIIVRVGDRNFSAHRNILMARSPVFQCMLSHDMLEKNSGVINVQDCDPQAMEQFLLYIYCGEIENLDESNMLGLYYAADKYEMWSLKDECCEFIKKSVSPENICNILPLAIDHDDSDLLEHVIEYFCKNSQNILHTAEWKSFTKSYFETASELLFEFIEKLKDADAEP